MSDVNMSAYDLELFRSGTHCEIYRKMGAHPCCEDGRSGVRFTVWAPHAVSVNVITSGSGWNEDAFPMSPSDDGIWKTFIPGAAVGELYRYIITDPNGTRHYKSDPYAFRTERRPANASVVCSLEGYIWNDGDYMSRIDPERAPLEPMAIYEVHPGSWKKDFYADSDGFLNYRTLANQLTEYVSYMGYTHVELIGIAEYPFDGSWGYQVTGYYAPTARYGTPDDFRYFVDTLHRAGIGVILDWVPAHFPKDAYGLACFDGQPLYESDDPLMREYPEWGTNAFDHSRPQVRSFLISNAVYWVKEFHIDAIRVDAVASMLYTSFGRSQYRVNEDGGTENRDGIAFLQQLNRTLRSRTHAYAIAEDSSIMAGITAAPDEGGLGFMFKWNMGWMNDTLKYVSKDSIFRKWHHGQLVHTSDYAFLEKFILVLSHDEVVHLKHSMLEKFPGGLEDRFGGLKSMYTFQFTFPGKKLLFMGQDFAMEREWDENRQIDWYLADDPGHRDVMDCVRALLSLYRGMPALYSDSLDERTFEWIRRDDCDRNIISYIRRNPWNYDGAVLVICNFSPVAYPDYACGVPEGGSYSRVFSTYDALTGSGRASDADGGIYRLETVSELCDYHPHRLDYGLRAYESVIFSFPKK